MYPRDDRNQGPRGPDENLTGDLFAGLEGGGGTFGARAPAKSWADLISTDNITERDALTDFVRKSLPRLSPDQQSYLTHVSAYLNSNGPGTPDKLIINGYAGTGKTTLLGPIAQYCTEMRKPGLPVLLLAHTNTAVENARKRTKGIFNTSNSRTVYSLLYGAPDENGKFNIGSPRPILGFSTVFMDEASLVSEPVMKDLIKVARKQNIKLIIVGDNFQLGAFESSRSNYGHATIQKDRPATPAKRIIDQPDLSLTQVIRQGTGSGILKMAEDIRLNNRVILPETELPETLPGLDSEGIWRYAIKPGSTIGLFTKLWLRNPGQVAAIVESNQDRVEINCRVRAKLGHQQSLLEKGEPLIVLTNTGEYTNGMRLEATQRVEYKDAKEYSLKRKAVVRGQETEIEEKVLVFTVAREGFGMDQKFALFPKTLAPSIALKTLAEGQGLGLTLQGAIPVTYGYAMTGHKAQGLEWQDVIIFPNNNPNWVYTAITRAAKRAYVRIKD